MSEQDVLCFSDGLTNQANRTQKPVALLQTMKLVLSALLFMATATLFCSGDTLLLPFDVSNPAHKKWSPQEAERIYDAACTLVARSIRPERPPRLHPRFLLVLGSTTDEIVRGDNRSEIHLKSWDPDKFAEATAIMVAREVIQGEELKNIAHMSVLSAHATTSVTELRRHQ